tara:strand:+ start:1084 stop:1524 length:441 start_codon:yes stop_codon:yes gene_type:complete
MRCDAVRQAIVDAITAITPDQKTTAGDVFQLAAQIEMVGRDRNFTVERTGPQEPANELIAGIGSGVADPYDVRFQINVYYQPTPGENATTRLLMDGDLVVDALRGLVTDHQQIRLVDIAGVSDFDDPMGFRIARWDLVITYDRRDS